MFLKNVNSSYLISNKNYIIMERLSVTCSVSLVRFLLRRRLLLIWIINVFSYDIDRNSNWFRSIYCSIRFLYYSLVLGRYCQYSLDYSFTYSSSFYPRGMDADEKHDFWSSLSRDYYSESILLNKTNG